MESSQATLNAVALTNGVLKFQAMNTNKGVIKTRTMNVTRGKEVTVHIQENGIKSIEIQNGQALITRICFKKQR